jgi:hypothetical protein
VTLTRPSRSVQIGASTAHAALVQHDGVTTTEPTAADVLSDVEQVSHRGRWGPDAQLATLTLLPDECSVSWRWVCRCSTTATSKRR